MNALTLTPGSLTLKQLRNVWRQPVTLSLDDVPPTASTPDLVCWRRRVSPRTIWKIYSARWCFRMRRVSVNRWMMTLSA